MPAYRASCLSYRSGHTFAATVVPAGSWPPRFARRRQEETATSIGVRPVNATPIRARMYSPGATGVVRALTARPARARPTGNVTGAPPTIPRRQGGARARRDQARRAEGATRTARRARRREPRCLVPNDNRRKGPKGHGTLCDTCGDRFSKGKTGPRSATSVDGATIATDRPTGETGRRARTSKIRVPRREGARPLTVLAIDVDAGTETRIPRPKRSSEAPAAASRRSRPRRTRRPARSCKVKRERDEALEDRLLCAICMEAAARGRPLHSKDQALRRCASCAAALRVPQLPRDDHDAHDDRELERGA